MTAPDGFPVDALDARSGLDGVSVLGAFPGSAGAASVSGPLRVPPAGVRRVPCTPCLRDPVLDLAARRGVEPGQLAASALLLADPARLAAMADPGAPGPGEPSAVLELRVGPGTPDSALRRALGMALALADPDGWRLVRAGEVERLEAVVDRLDYRNKALANALERVSFQPLEGGVTEVRDAALLFGFVNEWCFDEDRVLRRFRELAPVYHPDTGPIGSRERMAQLIEARNLLVRHVRTAYASGAWVGRRPR